MNCAIARLSRAMPPLRKVKRAPDIFAAVSKSMPRAGPMSACSAGLKCMVCGLDQRATSTLSSSSAPCGTPSAGKLGMAASAASSAADFCRSSSSSAGMVCLSCATSAFSASAVSVSPWPMALPIALEASLRRLCASCSRVVSARRSSSSASRLAAMGSRPRSASPASKASGFSLIDRRSCMGAAYACCHACLSSHLLHPCSLRF